MSVDLESDQLNLRRISFNLASGMTATYGGPVGKETEDVGFKKMTFEFFDEEMIKHDIVGIYGYVAPDPATNGDTYHIVSLGFLENTCPARGALDFEMEYKTTNIVEVVDSVVAAAEKKPVLLVVLSILIAGTTISVLYFGLKNRGKICRKHAKPVDGDVQETDDA